MTDNRNRLKNNDSAVGKRGGELVGVCTVCRVKEGISRR